MMFINGNDSAAHLPHLNRILDTSKLLNDTIPIKRIDSLYGKLLRKEGIDVQLQDSQTGWYCGRFFLWKIHY
jgi:hypothetical protein